MVLKTSIAFYGYKLQHPHCTAHSSRSHRSHHFHRLPISFIIDRHQGDIVDLYNAKTGHTGSGWALAGCN